MQMKPRNTFFLIFFSLLSLAFIPSAQAAFEPYDVVELRSLDKITGRTSTFEAEVGATLQYGNIYIRVQACRKRPQIETPESAAFMQVWEVLADGKSEWIFSGWMFASSPALSAMDHPIYDVWVLDCKNARNETTILESSSPQAPASDEIESEELE